MELQQLLEENFQLKLLKWTEIILQENLAVKRDSMYILVRDDKYCDLIFIDSNGNKRKIQNLSRETLILDFPLKDLANLTENDVEIWKNILGSLSGTLQIGDVVALDPSEAPTVENSGTPNAAILNFGIPVGLTGQAATIDVGQVNSIPSDQEPVITNVGTSSNAIFNFEIPVGQTGPQGEFVLEYNNDFDL